MRQTLVGSKATPEAVAQAVTGRAYLHFSCHGFYNWEDVMRSGLLLAGGKKGTPLTLAEIISKFDLSAARLVTLSACETGLTEFQQSPDEYIGLPAGFLQAGAPGVVSTLWAVADLSTALLMERFYKLHLQAGLAPAAALRQAQLWLRHELTLAKLEQYNTEIAALDPFVSSQLKKERERLLAVHGGNKNALPFAHPYYWAAFTFTGA
jgi:CHAT domain-containing protein